MLRSIDFKTMPYLFTDKAGTCLTVEFDGRELDDIYKQVKAMYDQAHSSDDMPTEPGWYATRDGDDVEGGSDCIDVRGDFAVDECRIELHDGRAVTCIRFNVYKGGGGLSCDWDNASGKDGETK